MVKKHQIALFINTSKSSGEKSWTRIKKSTELTLSMNGETKDYDFIADESPTKELDSYSPSIDQDLSMYENEPDYKFVFSRFYGLSVGQDAHVDTLVVFMQEGDSASGYKAWETDSIMNIKDLNAVDSKINFELLFGGTIKKGTVTVTGKAPDYVPVFAEEE